MSKEWHTVIAGRGTTNARRSDDASRAQFETNFFGPLALLRAVLPGMRARAAGCVVNVSSIGGIDGVPTSGVYAASKFALEGASPRLWLLAGPLALPPGPASRG